MDAILRLTLLYDYYGDLLTERQRESFELHTFNDLSLNEIGGQLGVSPQGVRDLLVRTEKNLADYEKRLGLVEKHGARQHTLAEISRRIDALSIPCAEKTELNNLLTALQ